MGRSVHAAGGVGMDREQSGSQRPDGAANKANSFGDDERARASRLTKKFSDSGARQKKKKKKKKKRKPGANIRWQ